MIAAPFLGEFGWEVTLWVPWLRHQMLHSYQGRDLTVLCRDGHQYLYEDFCDDILTFAVGRPIDKIDCQQVWIDGHRLTKKDYLTMAAVALRKRLVPKDTITPMDLRVNWVGDAPPVLKQSEYRPYGKPNGRIGIALHARASRINPDRNWSTFKWAALAETLGGNLASVGHPDQSLHVEGTEDLRGVSLGALCDLMSCSHAVVGPSSGPLALAMLCGTPVVWWSANLKDQPRFKNAWNPFNVEEVQAAQTWDPDVIEVEASCQKFL
jgi:hypothetical protein